MALASGVSGHPDRFALDCEEAFATPYQRKRSRLRDMKETEPKASAKFGLLLSYVVLLLFLTGLGCEGEHMGPGTPGPEPRAAADVRARGERQKREAPSRSKQILFGDLHVHTTFSPDAFVMSLPLMGGEGAHPPADACDYARYCAGLDFWSVNDHAEGISPQHWQETVDSIQACNAVAGDPSDPDTVAFLGWEWSQVGSTPETHYGHKNVILRDSAPDAVPARPIAAPRPEFRVPLMPLTARLILPMVFFSERQRYFDYSLYREEVESVPLCATGIDTRELPADCHEIARDPKELFAKLDQWDLPSLVIPHGTAWGLMAPPRSNWENQRLPDQHDPDRQNLIEVYSGHGNSESFRDWMATELDAAGNPVCGEPTESYEPCCWRAGEIIRARCEDAETAECDARVEEARRNYIEAGVAGHYTIPGATLDDWGECGQCTDCFLPAFNARPGMSAQYALAADFQFGFIGSSDTHVARAGNGFKEHARRRLTESKGAVGRAAKIIRNDREATPESIALDLDSLPLQARRNVERGSSYLYTGGLAAVHAPSRDREAIWDALERREVYGTSGERILLWFDLLNAKEGVAPMGSLVSGMREVPRFSVSAVGAFTQKPGCPDDVTETLSPDRLRQLCLNECYHPSDERRSIDRIEVVRIRASSEEDTGIGDRIEDPWRVLPCPAGGPACQVEFEDEEFMTRGPESDGVMAYYVRAIQEPSLAVNGGGFRCERNEKGECIRISPCYADDRTPLDDDCLSEVEERAWSSPIFLSSGSS